MKNFQRFESFPETIPPLVLADAPRRPKGYEMFGDKGAPTPAGGGCGCGKGGCGGGARGAATRSGGGALGPMGEQVQKLLAEAERTIQSAPGGDPSGKMGEAFRALQSLTAGLLDQINVADRRAKR